MAAVLSMAHGAWALPLESEAGGEDYFARPDRWLIVEAGLERARVYWPRVAGAARAEGVPEDLLFGMAMCESAFNPYARSRAGAEGMFQFMPATGRRYGLASRAQRRNVEQSARAAARHLAGLHRRLGTWELAVAAYNAGEGRVQRAVRRAGAGSWVVVRPLLPAETRAYVPAVLYMAHHVYPAFLREGPRARDVRLVRVTRGDTWWGLEREFGVPSELLMLLNRGRLVAGMWLAVPAGTAVAGLRAWLLGLDRELRLQLRALVVSLPGGDRLLAEEMHHE